VTASGITDGTNKHVYDYVTARTYGKRKYMKIAEVYEYSAKSMFLSHGKNNVVINSSNLIG